MQKDTDCNWSTIILSYLFVLKLLYSNSPKPVCTSQSGKRDCFCSASLQFTMPAWVFEE